MEEMDIEDVEDNIALTVVQEIESTSTHYSQHPESDFEKFRKVLNKSAVAMFTDLKIIADNSTNSINRNVSPKFFQGFTKCLDLFPQIFVPCCDNENQVVVTKEDNLASAFTEWLLMRLLRVLHEPSVSNVHEKCEDLIVSLLQLIRVKNPQKFQVLFLRLINLMSELVWFNERLHSNCSSDEKFTIEHYFTSEEVLRMEENGELDLTYIPIEISDPVSCGNLQLKLTFLLNRLISEVVQVLPEECENVWQVVCLQIELGDLCLKQESLNTVTSLIQTQHLPLSGQHVSYILDCLQGLIHLCCSDKISHFEDEENFEESVAVCFENVLKVVVTSEMAFAACSFALNSLLQHIMQTTVSLGLTNLKSEELPAAIGNGLFFLISFLKYHNCILPWGTLLGVQAAFIDHFGKLEDHKILSPFLILLIKLEVSTTSFTLQNFSQEIQRPIVFEETFSSYLAKSLASESSDKSYKVNGDQSLTHDSFEKQSKDLQPVFKSEKCPLYIKMKQSSTTWSSILTSLQNVLRNYSFSPNEKDPTMITNAVRTWVEILITSAFKGDNLKSSESVINAAVWMPTLVTDLTKNLFDVYILNPPGTSVSIERSCLFVDVLRSLHTYMIKVSSTPSIASRELFRELVSLASMLVNTQDSLQLTDEMYGVLCNVLSIPWLISGEEDLVNSELAFLPVGSIQHWRCLSSEAEEQCLQGLSLLPKHIHPQWRLKILIFSLTADDDDDLRHSAVLVLPLFIHSLELSKHDISSAWRTISEDGVCMIAKTVAKQIGKMSCVLNSSCVLCRGVESNGTLQLPCKLLCKICDGVNPSSHSSSLQADTFLQASLMNALKHTVVEVRKESLSSIPSYFAHNEITEELMHCLVEMITDIDIGVRTKFNSLLSYILRPTGREEAFGWTSAMGDIMVNKLKSVTDTVSKKENVQLQGTALEAFGELGKASKDELFLTSLLCLLKNLLSENAWLLIVTKTQLFRISDSKKMKTYEIYRRYREPISRFLAEKLMKCAVDDTNKALTMSEQITIVLGFRDVTSFLHAAVVTSTDGLLLCSKEFWANVDVCLVLVLKSSTVALWIMQYLFSSGTTFGLADYLPKIMATQRYILPYVVAKMAPETLSLLMFYSEILNVSKRNLLLYNFPFIFTHVVKNYTKSEVEVILGYIQGEARLEFGSLLRCNYQQVHNELLLHFGTHYKQVYSGLMTLALKNDKLSETERNLSTDEDVAAYLQPRLLGFLVFFDSQLLRSAVTLDDKKLALGSLATIMKLMGPRYITKVRFKIMATLRIALRFSDADFPKICCDAWKMLVLSVDVQSLGSILNQVIVSLLPILEKEPAAVADIFSFLIVQNQENLKDYFHDLYFIPDRPELQEIHRVLKQYVEDSSSQNDFRSLLSHSLRGLNHENLDVRLHALAQVKQVLQAHQGAVHEHLLTIESVDNVISNVVSVLIAHCRETDERARTLLGECLGELGAIDSGRLEFKSTPSKETMSTFYPSIEEENFAFSILEELVRCYLSASDCRNQDSSAYAIQELLKIYKCSYDESASPSGRRMWNKFSPDTREILVIFFNSHYKPSEWVYDTFPSPIYRSDMGSEFEEWISNWYFELLQKVKEKTAAKIFQSCSMIVKYDTNCAVLLLPYIVVYGLLDSTENESEQIHNEVVVVLTHSGESQASVQSDLCHLSCQTIFSVFDYLNKWMYHKEQLLAVEAFSKRSATGKLHDLKYNQDKGYVKIKRFISEIPEILLAKSSFSCQAYCRALMYLEQHIKRNPSDFSNNISFLQKLYAALDEPDGVAGVAAVRKEEPTLIDLMLEHEATGQMQDAFSCYEKAVKNHPEETNYYVGLLKCFMGMDQPKAALTYANGLLKDKPSWKENLNAFCVEAAWKLSSWDDLERYLEHEPASDKWNVGLGKILLSSRKGDALEFKNQLKIVRDHQMAPLSAAAMESGAYLRGYVYLARLHMLTDLEKGIRTLFDWNDGSSLDKQSYDMNRILSEWKSRKQLVQSSLRYQEPILNLHRVLLQMAKEKHPDLTSKFNHEISHCWLQSAKLARKNGHQQRAYNCLLEASAFNSPALFMEKTKWHWNKGEKEQAISSLQKGIQEHFPDIVQGNNRSNEHSNEDQRICAKAKLLLAIYSEESAITDSNSLIQMYRDVVALQPRWEESHFHLAKYYDKMLNTMGKQDSLAGAKADIAVHVAKNFGTSLKYGCKHVYHSLPRLLDLWFDMGTQVVDLSSARRQPSSFKQIEAGLTQLNDVVMPELFEKLPLFLFLTAFPQMISRICHSHAEVTNKLQGIITKLLSTYKQQVIWMMMAVSKSSYPTRVQRCKQIFQAAGHQNADLHKFIADTTKLADKFIELSNKSVTDSNVLSINKHFQILPRLLSDKHFSQVMLPLQSQMMVTLPSSSGSLSHHNPFPQITVHIHSVNDTVEIFSSLQRPKKITIRGTDGRSYSIICKPKDDLRKDCRLIEFNNLVNRYLKSDPEARKRQLYVRTYSVVPLNEECGLIEFVPNLSGLRQILNRIYRCKGIYVSGTEIKALMPARTATPAEKKKIFVDKFLPRFPPVFSEWFLRTFSDPTAWYLARLSYARTTAVMSMVGYIVGLGDRHGENILFDASCGDIVHVDLNCLFNKGETMECPEVVPFRLTQNMVDAMGSTGFEGVFRKACEVTMRVMRSQTDALMSVLRPFVHDPLVEWSRSSRSARSHQSITGEIRNEMGLTHVKDIEQRLNGLIKMKNKQQCLPLSIEGQVNYLINEATDIQNLSQMYVGWAPYM